MERAEFIFQIFFDKIDIKLENLGNLIISYKLLSLPSVDIDTILINNTETYEISKGKRINIKIPQIEILNYCPLEIYLRSPRSGHTSTRLSFEKISLQEKFELSLQNPNIFIKDYYAIFFKGKREEKIADLQFSLHICYTSSSMIHLISKDPIVLSEKPDVEQKKDIKLSNRTVSRKLSNRAPLIPDIPKIRTRSIFYFSKKDLLDENKYLTEEISKLSKMVQKLQDVIESNAVHKPIVTKTELKNPNNYIYRPPELY